MTDLTLDDAASLLLAPELHLKMQQLREAVPAGLRGIFAVATEHGQPVGLVMQPDSALFALRALQKQLPPEQQGYLSSMEHGSNLSRVFRDDEFDAILHALPLPCPRVRNAEAVERHLTIGPRDIAGHYRLHGIEHKHSFRLSQANRLGGLPYEETQALRRITQAIPENLRDCFACDLVLHPDTGKFMLGGISLAPDMVSQQLAATVFQPLITHYQQSNPSFDVTRLIRRHGIKMRLDHEQIMALGAVLKESSALTL